MQGIKESILRECNQFLTEKISFIENRMKAFQLSANQETKSSAGDKYETGRAMMHLEKEKILSQLAEFSKQKKTLDLIIPKETKEVCFGSLIETSSGQFFFISIGLGSIRVLNRDIFCVSVQAPISQLFLSKKKNDVISLNGIKYSIKELY